MLIVCFGIFILQGNFIFINDFLTPSIQHWAAHSWLQSIVTEHIKDSITVGNRPSWNSVSVIQILYHPLYHSDLVRRRNIERLEQQSRISSDSEADTRGKF